MRFNSIGIHVEISYCKPYGLALKPEFDSRSEFAGIIVIGNSNTVFRNCNILNNSYIGGVYLERSSVRFINCNISNNNGRALKSVDWIIDIDLLLQNCTISGNTEEAIDLDSDNVFIDQCFISNNEKGINLYSSNSSIKDCLFSSNSKYDINIHTGQYQAETINNCFSKSVEYR